MLRFCFSALLAVLLTAVAHAQAPAGFAGTLTYSAKNRYADPALQERYRQAPMFQGTEQTWLISGPNLLETTNGLSGSRNLFRTRDQLAYTFHPTLPWVFYDDLRQHGSFRKRTVLPAADTVLGFVCDVVLTETSWGSVRCSMHPKYRQLATKAATDTVGWYADTYPTALSIPLRRVTTWTKAGLTESQVATALTPAASPIDQAQFAAPAADKLVPGYSMIDNKPNDKEIRRFSEFLVKNLKYPKESLRRGVEGSVLLEFLVNEDSSISDIRILQHLDPACDAEAVRILSGYAKWAPRTYKGQPVKSLFSLPITFRLQ
ncbi:energy transducer TonB [Hymenobacter sp. BT175]|uniref:energy transducer TonB n=1 Tax=Hymenobacter translucens TaxID=2886507 RepID=UPI001D0DD4C8|nr:energy transducer TonB [Hymenobacter translucens]MCC2548120.1 energy transducer TonB [Hymenobacter translucens]